MPDDVDLPAWTKAKFDAGWRWLRVTRDNEPVAAIRRDPHTDQRAWWAEDAAAAPETYTLAAYEQAQRMHRDAGDDPTP